MKMSKFLSAAAVAALIISSPAVAQEIKLTPYVEGQISRMMIDDVDANTTVRAGGFNAALALAGEYEDDTAFGAEVGISGIGGTGFRAGLGFTKFDAELEAVNLTANNFRYNGVAIPGALSGRVTADQLRAAGADIGEEVKVFSVNAYYDFDLGSNFKPYLGLGVGMADIENMKDNELALSSYAGVNYAVTENLYAGLRASIHHVEGGEDEVGIIYDDIRTYSVGAVIGYKF